MAHGEKGSHSPGPTQDTATKIVFRDVLPSKTRRGSKPRVNMYESRSALRMTISMIN